MKRFLLATVAAGVALCGCATTDQDRVDPHKSYPDVKAGNVEPPGTLSVRGLPESAANTPGYQKREPGTSTMYTVYDRDGNFVSDSRSGTTDLPPGRYLVRLNESTTDEANRTFWVDIESGKTTIVDADRIHEAQKANAE
jgi:hypothetical protein